MEHSIQHSTTSKPVRQNSTPFFGKRSDPSFFSPATIQPKLTVGPVDDPYEREADAMADKVMRMSDKDVVQPTMASVHIQRKCAACEEQIHRKEDEDEGALQLKRANDVSVQRKCSHCEEEEKNQSVRLKPAPGTTQRQCAECEKEDGVHRKEAAASTPDVSPSVYSTIKSTGSPMDTDTRSFMESRFQYDFSGVRIHNDASAHRSSADINALAYTHGQHIVFGAGKYQTGTHAGKQLLAHELTHVVQQGGSRGNVAAQRIQRQIDFNDMGCAALIVMPELIRVNGVAAHNAIGSDFGDEVGDSAVRIRIENAAFASYATEGCGDAAPSEIKPVKFNRLSKTSGIGIPDLVYMESDGTDFYFEIAEIKAATPGCLIDAYIQVDRYISQANESENKVVGYNSKLRKWKPVPKKSHFRRMPKSRFNPKPIRMGNATVLATWCGDGVILYKAIKAKDDENKKKQANAKALDKTKSESQRKKVNVKIVEVHPEFSEQIRQATAYKRIEGRDYVVSIDKGLFDKANNEAMKRRLRIMQVDPRGVPMIQILPLPDHLDIPVEVLAIIAVGTLAAVAIVLLAPLVVPAVAAAEVGLVAAEGAVLAESVAATGTIAAGTTTAAATYTGVTSTGVTLTLIQGGAAAAPAAASAVPAVVMNLGKAAAALIPIYVALGSSDAEAAKIVDNVKDKKVFTIQDVTDSTVRETSIGSPVNAANSSFISIAKLTTRE